MDPSPTIEEIVYPSLQTRVTHLMHGYAVSLSSDFSYVKHANGARYNGTNFVWTKKSWDTTILMSHCGFLVVATMQKPAKNMQFLAHSILKLQLGPLRFRPSLHRCRSTAVQRKKQESQAYSIHQYLNWESSVQPTCRATIGEVGLTLTNQQYCVWYPS